MRKFGLGVQNKAGQRLTVLPREHTGHSKHPLPTTQERCFGVGGLTKGQMHPLRAEGKQGTQDPPRGTGGKGSVRLPPSYMPCTLLPGSGTNGSVCTDRQG